MTKVLFVAKDVMRQIGKEFTCQVLTEPFKIKPGPDGRGRIRIPENMMSPIIDLTVGEKASYQHKGGQLIKEENAFYVTSQEIIFDFIKEGECDITYHSFYVDEEGALIIGDIEQNAIYQSVMAEILKKSVVNPLKDKVLLFREDARVAILTARGQYNEMNKLRQRSYLRNRDGGVREKTYEYIKVINRTCKGC